MLSASELLARGRTASREGRHSAARSLLDRAVDRTDDPDLLALIDVSLAYVEAEAGEPTRGLARCDAALARTGTSGHTRGVALSQRALLLMRTGDTGPALADFAAAVPLLAEDPEHLGRLYLNRGNVHLHSGRLHLARADFESARRSFEDAGVPDDAAKAGFNLAYADLLAGDLVEALRGMERHGRLLAAQSAVNRAVVEQDRAEALLRAGLVSEAEAALGEAARAYGARRLRQYQGEALLVQARTLLRTRPQDAVRVAQRAARLFRGRGSDAWALRADAVALAAHVAAGTRRPGLVRRADELAAGLAERGMTAEATMVRLHAAEVQLARGEVTDAADRLTGVRLPAGAPLEARLLLRELRAGLAAARHQPARALGQVRTGLGELHAWQSSFGSLELQSNLVGHGRALARQGMRLACATGDPAAVYEWSERARTLVSRVTPVRPPIDPAFADELAELRLLLGRDPAPGSADARRIAALRRAVRQHSWYGAGSGDVLEPASADQVTDRLAADDAALLAHLVVDGELLALVVSGERMEVRTLGPAAGLPGLLDAVHVDLDMAASRMPEAVRSVVQHGLDQHLARLGKRLVTPVADLLGDQRVVLTPSGSLARTPWTLLPGLAGRPLTVPRSASAWARAAGDLPVPSGAGVGFVTGPGVPRAGAEVERAAGAWPADRSRLLPGGTAAEVVALAEQVDVLHVAAHGRHSADTPLFSGLVLADGTFHGYDIDQVSSVPRLVVLSACELGRAAVRAAEETVGMTAAWLHAGACTVIASPALVSDEAACEVLGELHHRLATGSGPAEALASATKGPAPAPFQCFGLGW